MKNKIEIYFILYIGLLITYFGIDSEIVDYKKKQEKILKRVAENKRKDLVRVEYGGEEYTDNSMIFHLNVLGDYDPDNFNAQLHIQDKNDKENIFIADLKKMQGEKNHFFSEVGLPQLPDSFDINLTYETLPYFGEIQKKNIEDDFGGQKIASKLLNMIELKETIRDTIPKYLGIYKKNKIDKFSIEPTDNPYFALKGTQGKVLIVVNGIKNENEFELKIDGPSKKRYDIQYKKNENSVTLFLNKIRNNGVVRLTGIKNGEKSKVDLRIQTIEPKWKIDHRSSIYVNDSYQFDGSLMLFDNLEDLARYELEISGSWGLIDRPYLLNGHTVNFPTSYFKIPGNITIKLFIDGHPVENMEHSVNVIEADPPVIDYELIENIAHFKIQSFGEISRINEVYFLGGISNYKKIKEEIKQSGEIEYYDVELEEKPNINMKIRIQTNYFPDIINNITIMNKNLYQ